MHLDEEAIEEIEDDDPDDAAPLALDDLDDDELEDRDTDDSDSDDSDSDDSDSDDSDGDDEDEGEEASLEELLDRKAAQKEAADSDDTADIMALASQRERDHLKDDQPKAPVLKDAPTFACSNCYLVKPMVQLADAERRLCRDCA